MLRGTNVYLLRRFPGPTFLTKSASKCRCFARCSWRGELAAPWLRRIDVVLVMLGELPRRRAASRALHRRPPRESAHPPSHDSLMRCSRDRVIEIEQPEALDACGTRDDAWAVLPQLIGAIRWRHSQFSDWRRRSFGLSTAMKIAR